MQVTASPVPPHFTPPHAGDCIPLCHHTSPRPMQVTASPVPPHFTPHHAGDCIPCAITLHPASCGVAPRMIFLTPHVPSLFTPLFALLMLLHTPPTFPPSPFPPASPAARQLPAPHATALRRGVQLVGIPAVRQRRTLDARVLFRESVVDRGPLERSRRRTADRRAAAPASSAAGRRPGHIHGARPPAVGRSRWAAGGRMGDVCRGGVALRPGWWRRGDGEGATAARPRYPGGCQGGGGALQRRCRDLRFLSSGERSASFQAIQLVAFGRARQPVSLGHRTGDAEPGRRVCRTPPRARTRPPTRGWWCNKQRCRPPQLPSAAATDASVR
eukprot:365278-Chlamydomonas_euryale.AAC.10